MSGALQASVVPKNPHEAAKCLALAGAALMLARREIEMARERGDWSAISTSEVESIDNRLFEDRRLIEALTFKAANTPAGKSI